MIWTPSTFGKNNKCTKYNIYKIHQFSINMICKNTGKFYKHTHTQAYRVKSTGLFTQSKEHQITKSSLLKTLLVKEDRTQAIILEDSPVKCADNLRFSFLEYSTEDSRLLLHQLAKPWKCISNQNQSCVRILRTLWF